MLGIGTMAMFWPSFAAHEVDYDKPFISETGYRSFMGPRVEVMKGIAPDEFASKVLRPYVVGEYKGKARAFSTVIVDCDKARRRQSRRDVVLSGLKTDTEI